MKNEKGITLIALVITIIVLLILAGVTIAMLTGDNGILNKSTQAVNDTTAGELKEAVRLAVATNITTNDGKFVVTGTDNGKKEEALKSEITKANANVTPEVTATTDPQGNITSYKVKVTLNKSEYNCTINAETGAITESQS